jgi:hypothetical protein
MPSCLCCRGIGRELARLTSDPACQRVLARCSTVGPRLRLKPPRRSPRAGSGRGGGASETEGCEGCSCASGQGLAQVVTPKGMQRREPGRAGLPMHEPLLAERRMRTTGRLDRVRSEPKGRQGSGVFRECPHLS